MSSSSTRRDPHRPDPPPANPPRAEACAETLAFAPPLLGEATQAGSSPARNLADGSYLPVGEMVGRYQVRQVLGRGGMGTVYLAQDTRLDRLVALKVPHLSDNDRRNAAKRFEREARTAATLHHPNICPIFDVGEQDGVPYLAMAYIEGRSLTEFIAAGKRPSERQAALVIRKAALALHEAHRHNIIHRDLKPANIMIDRRGEPVVMDFGLAWRADDPAATRLTQEGAMVGTPAYMAPEQIDDRAPIGPASDVYSLGVVLYELLTGQCPFRGSMVSVIGQVLHVAPPPIIDLRPDVSSVVAEICMKAIAKNPDERFPTMKELARALTAFLKGEASVESSVALAPVPEPIPELQPVETTLSPVLEIDESNAPLLDPVPDESTKRWSWWWLFAAFATLAGLGFLFLAVQRS